MDQTVVITLGLSAIAGIVWLVRLEGRVNHADKRIEYMEKRNEVVEAKVEVLDGHVVEELSKLRESVARIEGYLKKANEGD